MNLRDLSLFGRDERAGHPASAQDMEERIVTLGWACMVVTLLAAILVAAYVAI
jgi:hypothetical protein